MTTFSYTSGNPTNLTAGTNASMADIQGPFVDLRDFLNGGLDTANLTASAGLKETQFAAGPTGMAKGAFAAYRNAAAGLSTGVVIPFDTEEFDASGWYDTATGRYLPLVPGYYRLNAFATLNAAITAGQYFGIELFKNGTILKRLGLQVQVTGGLPPHAWGTATVVANGSTDFFDVRVNHNTGAAPGVTGGAAFCYFNGELIGRV